MSKFVDVSCWDFTKIKWLDQYMAGHNGFIAGGCFKQIFTGQRVKDVDIFFNNEEDWGKASLHYRDSEDYVKYYENNKVESYKCKGTGLVIELIKTVYGLASEVISNFDFTITKFAYYKHVEKGEFDGMETMSYKCLYHPLFFEHLVLKRLVVNDKVPFPASTYERMFRYGEYGYHPCRDTKIKIIEELRKMPNIPELSLALYNGLD